MGLFDRINRFWSGSDWWDKKENQQQRENFAQRDEEERKRREREAAARKAAQPKPQVIQPTNRTPVSDPMELFGAPKINNGLDALLSAPKENREPIKSVEEVIEKPNQSIWNKVRDIADANTEADKYRRTVREAKEINRRQYDNGMDPTKARDTAVKIAQSTDVPHYRGIDQVRDFSTGMVRGIASVPVAVPRIVTGLGEDIASLPSLGTRVVDWADRKRTGREEQWDFTKTLTSGTDSMLEHSLRPVSRFLDRTAEDIAGEGNTAGYRAAQIGGEIIGAVASGGTTAAVKASSKSSKAAQLTAKASELMAAGRTDDAIELIRAAEKLQKQSETATKIAGQLGGENRVADFFRKATDNPFEFFKGNKPVDEAVDVTGAIQDGSKVVPDAPKVEVAPGVFKSPTATTTPTTPTTPPVSQLPTPRVEPTVLPAPTRQISNATQQAPTVVPQAPQTIDPTIQKVVADIENKINEAKVAEVPPARVPESAPVETPIQKQSKEVAPGSVIAPEKVTTRQLTPDEMAERGFTPEQIDAALKYQADKAAGKLPEKPQPKSDPEAEAVKAERLRAEEQAKIDAAEDGIVDVSELNKTNTAEQLSELSSGNSGASKVKGSTSAKSAKKLPTKPQSTTPNTKELPSTTSKSPVNPAKTSGTTKASPEALDAARAKARAKTIAEPAPAPAKAELPTKPTTAQAKTKLPRKPKTPTQSELDKGAVENTVKSGKVSEAWKTKQRKAGATDEQINKAVEKVEGKKAEPTPEQAAKAADRKKTNEEYKQRKAEAEAEGRTKEAAPRLTEEMARQKSKEMDETVAYFKKHFGAQVKSFKIDEEMAKAFKKVEKYDEKDIGNFVKDYLKKVESSDDPIDLFDGIALTRKLEELRRNGKLTDEGMLDLADEVYQASGAKVSKSGQVQRIAQEIYKNVPAKTRVQKKLDNIETQFKEFNIDFKPTKQQKTELVNLTDEFDTAATNLTGLDGELATNLDEFAKATDAKTRAKLYEQHKQLSKQYTEAQQAAVDSSLAFNNKLKEITPELPKSQKAKDATLAVPDKVGNYLRMAMLSAPSGRVRDFLSTSINILDDIPVQIGRALLGRSANTITRKGKFVDTVGSTKSLKKGIKGGFSKLKSSWKGEYTLDEATGRIGTTDRSELLSKGKNGDPISSFGVKHSAKGSKWNLPRKLITTGVQAPTDLTYAKYTEELYNLGKVEARSAGLKGKDARRYAEMFMDSPTQEAQNKAAQAWLANSGMQKNKISDSLTKLADKLDQAGSTKYKKDHITGKKVQRSTAERLASKSLGRMIRTTTIPFVQYTGGSTHAMLMRQNPVANFGKFAKSATWGKDPQKAIDELARGGWNTTKIGALAYAMDKGYVETSDTDADGKSQYGGPYLVRTKADGSKEYVPASTLGIAGGSAIIGAHAVNKFFRNMKEGDPVEALAAITSEAAWNTVKASGLNNMLTGKNVLGGTFENAERVYNNPDKSASDAVATVGAGIIGDIGSQAVPAASRDLNVLFDQNEALNPTGEKPDLSGKDPVTGKVDPLRKAYGQIAGGIPVISQTQFPRKSGELARDFEGRVLNANTQSDQQAAAIRKKEGEKQATLERGKSLFDDDNITKLLSEETLAIHNKYKGDVSKASEDDMDAIWKDVKDKKDTLIDDGNFDSYASVLQYELDEKVKEGGLSNNDKQEAERNIGRAKLAGTHNVDSEIYRLYTGDGTAEGGGISSSEFNKMMDPDDELYDPDTAALLWELDQLMTNEGLSANSNGINPWTRPKYREPKNGWGGSKGSGKKTIATDFGSIAGVARPSEGTGQKYKKLSEFKVPTPAIKNSRTNLKKKISVAKGVQL